MDYQISFACDHDEEKLQKIFIDSDMDMAGDIQEHVLIKKDNDIQGGGMLMETSKGVFHLLVFAMKQNSRSQGIGSQLLQELIKQPWKYCLDGGNAVKGEYRITTVAKGKSANFYRKNGFSVCEFSMLDDPFNEQCTECPEQLECNPAAMQFASYGENSLL